MSLKGLLVSLTRLWDLEDILKLHQNALHYCVRHYENATHNLGTPVVLISLYVCIFCTAS